MVKNHFQLSEQIKQIVTTTRPFLKDLEMTKLLDKIREEILHLKMKELQRTNGINTGADVYLSSYAVLSIISNALTEESEDERIRKKLYHTVMGTPNDSTWFDGTSKEAMLAWLEEQKDKNCLACDQHLKGYIAGRKVTEEEKQKEQKPAWKPSEEQMNALNFAITHFVHYTNYKNLTELRELYDDLLKLK